MATVAILARTRHFFVQLFVVDRFSVNYNIAGFVMLCMPKLAFEKL